MSEPSVQQPHEIETELSSLLEEGVLDEAEEQEVIEEGEETGAKEVSEELEEEIESPLGPMVHYLDDEGNEVSLDVNEYLKSAEHTAVINGEEVVTSYDELIDNFQKATDYTKKTEALANEKRELGPFYQVVGQMKADPQFQEYVNRYFTDGPNPQLHAMTAPGMTDMEVAQLMSQGEEGMQQAQQIMAARAQMAQEQAQRQQVDAYARQQQDLQQKMWADMESQKAREIIPDFEEIGGEAVQTLQKTYGFAPEETATILDHRIAHMAADLARYHRLLNEKESTNKELEGKRKAPLPPRVVRSGPGKRTPNRDKTTELVKRAKKTGSNADIEAALAQMLG